MIDVDTARRSIRNRATAKFEEYKRLTPPGGTIGIGCADFDAWIAWYALDQYLYHSLREPTLTAAFEKAQQAARDAVLEWNRTHNRASVWGRYEMDRDKDAAGSILLWAHTFLCAAVRAGAQNGV